jgi:phage shock protein A
MATSPIQQIQQAETDIAVLKVKLDNLDEKVSEVKAELSEVHEKIEETAEKFTLMMREFQTENMKSHRDMYNKITVLEKWRWMVMGAGIVIGALGSYVASGLLRLI